MNRLIGILMALTLFFGAPAVAVSCTSTNQICCCTNMKNTTGHCPMVKSAPSPVSAILSDAVNVAPALYSLESLPAMTERVADSIRFIWNHDSQAPPGRAEFSSPSSLRGPPAFLA